jgi:DNA primase
VQGSLVTEIKSRLALSSVIKKAVQLKGHGPKYVGLCPFHQEKTPSFNVDDKRALFKCFGCGISGDVFEFIMRLRGLSFKEALSELSLSAGIMTPRPLKNSAPIRDKKVELIRAQKIAHRYFVNHINNNQAAKDYLRSRSLTDAMIEQAQIGFGGLSSRDFLAYLLQNNISERLGLEAGLIKLQGSALKSVFWGRIVFPIRRYDGTIIAFGARSFLPQDHDAPKYINTHVYELYEKRTSFYGIFESKSAIAQGKTPVLVEGYFDAMALWALGLPALALCGTALSKEHASVLRRLSTRVLLCFDGDEAGFRALRLSLKILLTKNMGVKVITLDNKKDPGDYMADLAALKNKIAEEQDALCFAIDQISLSTNTDITKRLNAIDEIMGIFMSIGRPLMRRQYVAYLAKKLHEDPGLLWADMLRRFKNKPKNTAPREIKKNVLTLTATEKLVVQIMIQHPSLKELLSFNILNNLSDIIINYIVNNPDTSSELGQMLHSECLDAAPLSCQEAEHILKALDHKLARATVKDHIRQKRNELKEAEKAHNFSLVLQNLKEQSLILAHKNPVTPKITKDIPCLTPHHDEQDEEDWL